MADPRQPNEDPENQPQKDEGSEFELDLDALTFDEPGVGDLDGPTGVEEVAEDMSELGDIGELGDIDALTLDEEPVKTFDPIPRKAISGQLDGSLPEDARAGSESELSEDEESEEIIEVPVETGEEELEVIFDDEEEQEPSVETAAEEPAETVEEVIESESIEEEAVEETADEEAAEEEIPETEEEEIEEDVEEDAKIEPVADLVEGGEMEVVFDEELEEETVAEPEDEEIVGEKVEEMEEEEPIVDQEEAVAAEVGIDDDEDDELIEDILELEDDEEEIVEEPAEEAIVAPESEENIPGDEEEPVFEEEDELVAYDFQDDDSVAADAADAADADAAVAVAAGQTEPETKSSDGETGDDAPEDPAPGEAPAGKKRRTTPVEMMALGLVALICVIGVIVFLRSVATGLPSYDGPVISEDVPDELVGDHLKISEISAYWRDKRPSDRVDPDSVSLPAVRVKLSSGEGNFQMLIRDETGNLKGDSITVRVKGGKFETTGSDEMELLGTVGFINQFYFAEYRSIDNRDFWSVTLRESVDNKNWNTLATFHMPTDYQQD